MNTVKSKITFVNIVMSILVLTGTSYSAFNGEYTFQLESATNTQINTISSPQNGMMFYNSDDHKIYYYDGSSWVATVGSNLYTADGNLSGNREMNLNTHDLSFINGNVGFGNATPDATVDINGSLRLDGVFYDKDGDAGTLGQVLTSTVTGTDWVTPSLTPVPHISSSTINIPISTTKMITLLGSNFNSSSVVSIPGFDGSIHSTTVISPSEIQINITTGTIGVFDVIVSNVGVLNTQWAGNGVGLLTVSNNNGQAQSVAGLTCKSILDDGFSTGDGIYWINPNGGSAANAFEVYCDMTNDGGGWTLVFRHDTSGGFFANDSEADSFNESAPGLTTKKYSILNKIDSIKSATPYEFRLYYPNENTRNHWTQTFDPRSGPSPTRPVGGYSAIAIDSSGSFWGGLERSNTSRTFLDGSVNHGNWWYAIGTSATYGSGMPGPSLVVNIVELYIR